MLVRRDLLLVDSDALTFAVGRGVRSDDPFATRQSGESFDLAAGFDARFE
jgi:hypothetical protein